MSSVTVTTPAQADSVWVVGDRITFLGEVPGTALSLLEVEVPPGSGTPPHTHASPELFRVLSGEVTFGIFATTPPHEVVARAGTVVTVPPHAAHNYRNTGSQAAAMTVVLDRSMVEFFRDLGRRQAPAGGPPSEAEIAEVMAACVRHQIRLLPSPPP
ncbi:MAG: cupin domain-containing protein [Opitutaceae bacterium]|nr:cupin domain-containing protein [Opitutaceae bacterium]